MQVLGSNIVVEILAAIAVAVIGWLLSIILRWPFFYRQRRSLFEFFGVSKGDQRFLVYLSTLFVRRGGSADFRGNLRSFQGPAIPAAELTTVQPVSQLFISPFLLSLPTPIRNWLGNKVHWTFQQLLPEFSFSPPDRGQVEPTNMLTVGSQYYNSAGDLYTEIADPYLRMEQVDRGMIIRVKKGPREGDVFHQRPNESDDLAILERLFDEAHETSVFIAAGLGVVGTLGAVHYLVDNWQQLHKDFGAEPFAVCLRFQGVADDPYAYKKPVELSRFQ
jgi:hypothetical protein